MGILLQWFCIFATETKLIIHNGEGKHEGLYQCFAENEAGIQYTTMAVNVDVTKRDSGMYLHIIAS